MAIAPKTWTDEQLERLTKSDLKSLRENAKRLDQKELEARCNTLLEATQPVQRLGRRATTLGAAPRRYVAGYHFVCANNNGVEELSDGRFWSRTWVVAKPVAENSLRYGAYLALHETKSDHSYRQGLVERIEVGQRFDDSRTEYGIDFLVRSEGTPKVWVGDGAGEKGYLWQPLVHVLNDGQE